MLLATGAIVAACVWPRALLAQPARCFEDSQCLGGSYCEFDSYHCRECLRCENLQREPPRSAQTCIRSVAECGPCLPGLVEDGGGESQCVPPGAGSEREGGALPASVWVAVVVGMLLLLALVVVIGVYVLRNTYTFKILASTRASVQSACGAGVSAASAPELPPPYDASCPAPYNPLCAARDSSPSPPSPPPDVPAREEESSWPFIKRVPSERGAGAREAAGLQAARVYNYPRYVRAAHLPASYDSLVKTEETESTFTVHDEDTMESTWTPTPGADHADHAHHADANGNAGTSGPLAQLSPLAAPAAAHAPHAPHAPLALCARQDTNNNRNHSESNVTGSGSGGVGGVGGEGSGEVGGAHVGPSFIINVVQNINAVQQHNDVTL